MNKRRVEYPSQDPNVLSKIQTNGFKFKNYLFPSGNVIKIQGYEDKAIDDLLTKGINESDIKTGYQNVPTIIYEHKGQKNDFFRIFILKKTI